MTSGVANFTFQFQNQEFQSTIWVRSIKNAREQGHSTAQFKRKHTSFNKKDILLIVHNLYLLPTRESKRGKRHFNLSQEGRQRLTLFSPQFCILFRAVFYGHERQKRDNRAADKNSSREQC